jgi:hypothetical protein
LEGAAAMEGDEEAGSTKTDTAADAAEEAAIIENGFRELRGVWVRPWPDHDDRAAMQAYRDACREVGHDAVLAGARAWVAAADAPRFLPKLSDWLVGRAYLKQPPQKRSARPPRQRPPRKEKGDYLALAMLAAR